MGEGLINSLFSDKFEAVSAGTEISEVKYHAIKVMQELGIDISKQYSKHFKTFYGNQFDLVITVCDNAKKVCPIFPGAKRMIHKSFPDPSLATGSEEEKLNFFRGVRDQIFQWIKEELVPQYDSI